MVAPRFRSRRLRRVKVKTPGGVVKTHYERRMPGKPQCSECGEYLKGVARGTISVIRKMSKSERKPERPYGGTLCSKCMRKEMISRARSLVV